MRRWNWETAASVMLTTLVLQASALAQAVKQLEVAPESVIAAPRDGRILMLVDVQAHKKWLLEQSEDVRKSALIATATYYATQTLQSGRFDGFTDAEVILAMVENLSLIHI